MSLIYSLARDTQIQNTFVSQEGGRLLKDPSFVGSNRILTTYEATHSGILVYGSPYPRGYSPIAMRDATASWVTPLPKQIYATHTPHVTEVIGTVRSAKYVDTTELYGVQSGEWWTKEENGSEPVRPHGHSQVTAEITDKDWIQRILDQRAYYVSIDTYLGDMRCRICGAEEMFRPIRDDDPPKLKNFWNEKVGCCKNGHDWYMFYDKKMAFPIANDINYRGLAHVVFPADVLARAVGVQSIADSFFDGDIDTANKAILSQRDGGPASIHMYAFTPETKELWDLSQDHPTNRWSDEDFRRGFDSILGDEGENKTAKGEERPTINIKSYDSNDKKSCVEALLSVREAILGADWKSRQELEILENEILGVLSGIHNMGDEEVEAEIDLIDPPRFSKDEDLALYSMVLSFKGNYSNGVEGTTLGLIESILDMTNIDSEVPLDGVELDEFISSLPDEASCNLLTSPEINLPPVYKNIANLVSKAKKRDKDINTGKLAGRLYRARKQIRDSLPEELPIFPDHPETHRDMLAFFLGEDKDSLPDKDTAQPLIDDTSYLTFDQDTLTHTDEMAGNDAKLSTKERKRLSPKTFCGPGRSFPIPDRSHVLAGLRLLGRYKGPGKKSAIRACILRKAKAMGMKIGSRGKDSLLLSIRSEGAKDAAPLTGGSMPMTKEELLQAIRDNKELTLEDLSGASAVVKTVADSESGLKTENDSLRSTIAKVLLDARVASGIVPTAEVDTEEKRSARIKEYTERSADSLCDAVRDHVHFSQTTPPARTKEGDGAEDGSDSDPNTQRVKDDLSGKKTQNRYSGFRDDA